MRASFLRHVFRVLCALLLPVLLLGSGIVLSSSDTIEARLQEMVSTKYNAYQETNGLPGGAGILMYMQSPSGNWLATAGLPEGSNENWHYRIASVSKTFTAASIMLLDQQGKLNIDDLVTADIPGQSEPYLPGSPNYAIPNKDQITIRQLLSHRAGVFDVFNYPVPATSGVPYAGTTYGAYMMSVLNGPDHQFTLDELAAVLVATQASFSAPGEEYHYSDTGYSLLAKIIQRVSGQSYDRFLADNFFGPMGLTETSAPWSAYDNALPDPSLSGYSNIGSGFVETTEDNMSSQVGPGNIISTPADITTWVRTLLSGGGPLTREQAARMLAVEPGNKTYGLGIGNSEAGAGHSGAHPGFVNLVGYNPDDDVAVVVVTPFIDYNNLEAHLALITEVAKEAREIAGYTGTWPR